MAHVESCAECEDILGGYRLLGEAVQRDAMDAAALVDAGLIEDITQPSTLVRFRRRPDSLAGEMNRLMTEADEGAARVMSAIRIGLDEAREEIQALEEHPNRGLFLIYVCQLSAREVPTDPARYLGLADLVEDAAKGLAEAKERRVMGHPALETVLGEANLLRSQALLSQGRPAEARTAAQKARAKFRKAGEDPFTDALCDYFEGSAAGFMHAYERGEKLLARASNIFATYKQPNWLGRSVLAQATLLLQSGDAEASLPMFDEGLASLDPKQDAHAVAAGLLNKGAALVQLNRLDQARIAYARALKLTVPLRLYELTQSIRNGLAETEFRRGRFERALTQYSKLAEDARRAGLPGQYLRAILYVAECLGELSRRKDMERIIDRLRGDELVSRFGRSPAFEELFAVLSKGELEAGLIAHVRGFFERSPETFLEAPYTPYRQRN